MTIGAFWRSSAHLAHGNAVRQCAEDDVNGLQIGDDENFRSDLLRRFGMDRAHELSRRSAPM
jgi:hypothetical protein